MTTPRTLQDVYTDELKDLWSANDQMGRLLPKLAEKASDPDLKDLLERSQNYIAQHTDTVKEVLAATARDVEPEHCKGMAGLVAEATKHVIAEGPEPGPVLDAIIIAQYQRMSHYGIAGFGTAAAYARQVGDEEGAEKLTELTGDIYGGDEYMSLLAESSINPGAASA